MTSLQPTPKVVTELGKMLRNNDGNLGLAFGLWERGLRTNRQFVDHDVAANTGAAGNTRATIEAIMLGVIPTGPTVAVIARSSVNRLLKRNPQVSQATRNYLDGLVRLLTERAEDRAATESEERSLSAGSEEIQQKVGNRSGVYVYTYPMYRKNLTKTDPDRWLFKIGKSDRNVLARIRQQTTGMPEPAVLLRVYVHKKLQPLEIERILRRALTAAGHECVRDFEKDTKARRGPKEWYATRLEFLDTVAQLIGCEALSAASFGAND